MLSDAADGSYEVFELCLSVWTLILSHCPEKEVGEVRRILGASLIEQVSDLREEVITSTNVMGMMLFNRDSLHYWTGS